MALHIPSDACVCWAEKPTTPYQGEASRSARSRFSPCLGELIRRPKRYARREWGRARTVESRSLRGVPFGPTS
jgi:hypothetical protein